MMWSGGVLRRGRGSDGFTKTAARCFSLAIILIGFVVREPISHADDRDEQSVSVNIRTSGRCLETDWLLGIRMPDTGTSEGLVIRYRVSCQCAG